MKRRSEFGEALSQKKSKPSKLTREMLFLAEQAAEGKLKVLPSKEWLLHYPTDEKGRAERLQQLLDGKCSAEEAAHDIKPDALFYNIEDIESQGLEQVSARIRNLSSFITYFDYPRFARFVEGMRGRGISLAELDNFYNEITQARVQKRVLDAFGSTGRKQIEEALKAEVADTSRNIKNLPRVQKVLEALKTDWVSEDLGFVPAEEKDLIISELSGDERKLFNDLESSYRDYIQTGDEEGYKKIVETIKNGLPKIQKEIPKGASSESMKELKKELEKFEDKAVPPGAPEDPAIPPEDSDEYHTPPLMSGESKEKMRQRPIFEIKPALGGYYASGRKSYFDIKTKTWSKKKQLVSYGNPLDGKERSTISGAFDSGVRSIPLPCGYALDINSLQFKDAKPEIFRDQNGCFYIKAEGVGSFSMDFLKEPNSFVNPPITEDTDMIYQGLLSEKTELTISRFIGSPLQKAERARQYILANHFYPGGGDLQSAQALQYKLRSESTGDNYLQNIDKSEYLECYSANTLFVAMLRKAGIPVRLVVGHRVEGAQDGKSFITQSTGHAWAEIWDGKAWRRFDATPNAKPEDKKEKDKKSEKSESAPEAKDDGVEKPQDDAQQSGDQPDGKGQRKDSSESSKPTDKVPDASDGDLEQGKKQLEQAKEAVDKAAQQKKEFDEKIDNAEKFKDYDELKKEIEESEIFDDLKEELQKKLESKEDQTKDAIKESLDQMVEDGFMDEKRREEIEAEMEKRAAEELDKLREQLEQENKLYNNYEDIREEIMPLVEKWFRYFAERLPHQDEIGFDEDSLTRQGAFSRKSIMRARNLLFGIVKNPRQINPSIKPRFMSSILIDVSGSMGGEKLKNAQKLLVFYSELFSQISKTFGYIRFSINTFSDSVTEIKKFDQDYDSPQRYEFSDGDRSTIKVRLMKQLVTRGGTNMLDGIKRAAQDLNHEIEEYPDYAAAFYFVGDGGDTYGNASNIKQFLQINDRERGFGEHMYSAILLGGKSQRKELADIFGEEHTNVVPNFEELIEQSMDKFDEDLEEYLKTKTA